MRRSGSIAGDQCAVDGADRRADDPVGLDAGLMQGLDDADLVGAERAAALQHEHGLWPRSRRWLAFFLVRIIHSGLCQSDHALMDLFSGL